MLSKTIICTPEEFDIKFLEWRVGKKLHSLQIDHIDNNHYILYEEEIDYEYIDDGGYEGCGE